MTPTGIHISSPQILHKLLSLLKPPLLHMYNENNDSYLIRLFWWLNETICMKFPVLVGSPKRWRRPPLCPWIHCNTSVTAPGGWGDYKWVLKRSKGLAPEEKMCMERLKAMSKHSSSQSHWGCSSSLVLTQWWSPLMPTGWSPTNSKPQSKLGSHTSRSRPRIYHVCVRHNPTE